MLGSSLAYGIPLIAVITIDAFIFSLGSELLQGREDRNCFLGLSLAPAPHMTGAQEMRVESGTNEWLEAPSLRSSKQEDTVSSLSPRRVLSSWSRVLHFYY